MNFSDAPTSQQISHIFAGLDFSSAPLTQSPPHSHTFEDIAERLRLCASDVCAHLLPGGRIQSGEYCIGDIAGNKGNSLKINLRSGRWADFAGSDSGGDLIALWASVRGITQAEARDEAAAWLGIEEGGGGAQRWTPRIATHSEADDHNWWRRAEPTGKWIYTDAAGEPVATVYRFDRHGEKTYRPWNNRSQRWSAPERDRPLYQLPELIARASEPVVIAEGEKAAESLRECGFLATCIMSGARSADKADWTPLRGRHLVLWPDRDDAGEKFAAAVEKWARAVGAASLRRVAVPAGPPDGFDAADATPEERKALVEAAVASTPIWPAETAKTAETIRPAWLGVGFGAFGNFARGIPSATEPFEPLDRSLLGSGARPAPAMPIDIFGPFWAPLLSRMAERAGAPVDYVACALLAGAAALIGDTRRVSAHADWVEPCILWVGLVGTPSSGKSPARDRILSVLRQIEIERAKGFPERLREWQTKVETAKLAEAAWKAAVEAAVERGEAAPIKPTSADIPPQPSAPRLIVNDATVEKLAYLLAAERRGLMLHCDELARLLGSFDRYGGAGSDRAFWLEAFGGRPYSVDRQKIAGQQPLYVPALMVSIIGGIPPDRLSSMLLKSDDDGLAARFLWTWPEPVPPTRPQASMDGFTLESALCKLSSLQADKDHEGEPRPRVLPLAPDASDIFHDWRIRHAGAEAHLAGITLSQHGKMPGMVMRLALVLQHLAWCSGDLAEPVDISADSIRRAIVLVDQYFKPMAGRVFGDAARPTPERNAAVIAKWIIHNKKTCINARDLRRTERLPGLSEQKSVAEALNVLGEAGWIRQAARPAGAQGRPREDYEVNPEALS